MNGDGNGGFDLTHWSEWASRPRLDDGAADAFFPGFPMTLTPRLIAVAAFGMAAFLAPAAAQITLTVANSGFESAVSSGFPTTAGTWGGDTNAIAAAGTVTPYAGSSMLSFLRNGLPDGTNGTSSDTFQIVDLAAQCFQHCRRRFHGDVVGLLQSLRYKLQSVYHSYLGIQHDHRESFE